MYFVVGLMSFLGVLKDNNWEIWLSRRKASMSRVMVSGKHQDLLSDTDYISPLKEANAQSSKEAEVLWKKQVLLSTKVSWRELFIWE